MIRARTARRGAAAAALAAVVMWSVAMWSVVPADAQAPGPSDLFAPPVAPPAPPDAEAAPSPEGSPTPSGSPSPDAAPTLGRTLPDTPAEATGTWDLSLDGTTRRCMLTFGTESGPNGRPVRFPAGCRRALPLLGSVAGWLFAGDGLRLVDRNVRPLLLFARRPDGRSLTGRSEAGETYNLVPLQIGAMAPKAPDPSPGEAVAPAPAPAGGGEIPGSQPVLPADALRPATASAKPALGSPPPGLYALDRFSEKDVCRIELDPLPEGTAPEKALAPARLLPGCRDSGITVFDPGTWRFAGGLMTLRSRRGHAVNLVAAGEGVWRRDPDIGTTFVLRRVER